MRFRDLERLIKDDGWYEVAQRGSHHQYKHPIKKGKVTINEHGGKEYDRTYIKLVFKQAGI